MLYSNVCALEFQCSSIFMAADNFPKLMQLNFTISGSQAGMLNYPLAPGKIFRQKRNRDFFSSWQNLLFSGCSVSSENLGSFNRVNNMLPFFLSKYCICGRSTLYTTECSAKISLAKRLFAPGDYWGGKNPSQETHGKSKMFSKALGWIRYYCGVWIIMDGN